MPSAVSAVKTFLRRYFYWSGDEQRQDPRAHVHPMKEEYAATTSLVTSTSLRDGDGCTLEVILLSVLLSVLLSR